MLFLLGAAQILWLPELTVQLLWAVASTWAISAGLQLKFKPFKPVLWFLSGLLYALLACQLQSQQQLSDPIAKDLQVRVEGLPKYSTHKVSFIGTDQDTGQNYLLSHYHADDKQIPSYQTGAIYSLQVNLKPPHGMVNGVGFDREKWLFRHGIDGVGGIKTMALAKPPGQLPNINSWRAKLSSLIDQHFTNPATNALIHALSIGDKSHFSQQDIQMFQNTGTAHLIAISGLHIGMVALLGWLLGGLCFRFWPQQTIPRPVLQIILGIVFAAFYAGLAGFTVATQRALIMLLVYGMFKLSRRPSYAWDVWSGSLLVVLLLDPLNVLDGGFWLSFTAVAVLILAFNGNHSNPSKILTFVKMQLALLVGMLPISLALFSKVNLLAPLVNLVMIPLMTFVLIPMLMLLLLMGSLLQSFPDVLVSLVSISSEYLLLMLSWFNRFDLLAFDFTISHWWQYLALIIGAVLLTLPQVVPQRHWGLLLIFLGFISPSEQPPVGQFKASFLDVGQGLSVVIETQNHTAVYDVGAAYDSGFNMANAAVLPFLQQHDIKLIDALILSHQDNDHAGAAVAFKSAIPVLETWGTEPQQTMCQAGQKWTWDGVTFHFLSPLNLTPYLQNNSSCVLKINNQQTSLLLTGDIEAPVEYRLTHMNRAELVTDVLLIPHHGSKTSSTPEFIKTVNPKHAINSSGQFNPFGHPAAAVLQRYEQLGIPVTDTQSGGLITLHTYPELKIDSLRMQQARIWRKKKPD